MRKKTNVTFFPLLIMGIFFLCSSSCEKDNDNNNPTNGKTTALFNPNVTYGKMTDQDGNVYKTVTIDTQTWMAENLRTTKYNDGSSITNVTGATEWVNLTTGAYCDYNNTTNIDTIATYGRLYNWYAVNTGKLAPKGWHVPTDDEWSALIDYLGGIYVAGDKLKETGTTHWIGPNTGATNETGFTALPGGIRTYNGYFGNVGYYGIWWSATEFSAANAGYRLIDFSSSDVFDGSWSKELGFFVRCVRD
jgi:uncharacterized protein (TIGR02145 family)